MAIDYSDSRDNTWISVGPQSYLDAWRPVAVARGWSTIDALCDNTLQVFDLEHAIRLRAELRDLIAVLRAGGLESCNRDRQDAMIERLDRILPHIVDAIDNWDGVDLISIG